MYVNKHSSAIAKIITIYAVFGFVGSLVLGSIFRENMYIFLYCISGVIVSLIPMLIAYHIAAAIEDNAYKNYTCMNEMYKLVQGICKNDSDKDEENNEEINSDNSFDNDK